MIETQPCVKNKIPKVKKRIEIAFMSNGKAQRTAERSEGSQDKNEPASLPYTHLAGSAAAHCQGLFHVLACENATQKHVNSTALITSDMFTYRANDGWKFSNIRTHHLRPLMSVLQRYKMNKRQ